MTGFTQRTARAQRLWLARIRNVKSQFCAVTKMLLNLAAEIADQQHNVGDRLFRLKPQLMFEIRRAGDMHHRLRDPFGERPEAGTEAASEDHGLHVSANVERMASAMASSE